MKIIIVILFSALMWGCKKGSSNSESQSEAQKSNLGRYGSFFVKGAEHILVDLNFSGETVTITKYRFPFGVEEGHAKIHEFRARYERINDRIHLTEILADPCNSASIHDDFFVRNETDSSFYLAPEFNEQLGLTFKNWQNFDYAYAFDEIKSTVPACYGPALWD